MQLYCRNYDMQFLYTVGFLSAELKGQINAFLKRAFKYVFCTSVHTIDVIAEEADRSLFAKMAGSQHCLHTLFSDIKPYSCRLRPKGHAYKLPECSRDLYKKSFHHHHFIYSIHIMQ